jgi:hypothetical protein
LSEKQEKKKLNFPEKQLSLQDILTLKSKTYKVMIPDLGFVQIRRSTSKDHALANQLSNDGDDSLRFQNILVAQCVTNPKMSEEDVNELPEGIPTLILQSILNLSDTIIKSGFLAD